MTLATQLSLTTIESLQNGLQTHFKVLTLMLLPGVTVQQRIHGNDLGAISQYWRRGVALARCKGAFVTYCETYPIYVYYYGRRYIRNTDIVRYGDAVCNWMIPWGRASFLPVQQVVSLIYHINSRWPFVLMDNASCAYCAVWFISQNRKWWELWSFVTDPRRWEEEASGYFGKF